MVRERGRRKKGKRCRGWCDDRVKERERDVKLKKKRRIKMERRR